MIQVLNAQRVNTYLIMSVVFKIFILILMKTNAKN